MSGGERVVWFHDWSLLPGGTRLGSPDAGPGGWGAAPDAALTGRAATLLYFDVAGYDDAVRGLPPEEVERAVLHRREVFRLGSNDVGRVLESLHSGMAHASKTGDAAAFDELLALAVGLFAGGRFGPVDTPTLLAITLDADALAVAEAQDLPLEQDAAALERRYGLDAKVMAAHGRPQYTRGLLRVPRPRLCRIGPKDEALHGAFHDELHVVGPDWIAGPWPEHAILPLRESGKQVDVLAFEPGAVAAWVLETPAQAQRDVQAALDASRADPAAIAKTHGRDVRFRQHAVRVQAAARLASEGDVHAAEVAKDVEVERGELAGVYARSPDVTTPGLDAAVARARSDAELLATRDELPLGSRNRWSAVAGALAAFTRTGP